MHVEMFVFLNALVTCAWHTKYICLGGVRFSGGVMRWHSASMVAMRLATAKAREVALSCSSTCAAMSGGLAKAAALASAASAPSLSVRCWWSLRVPSCNALTTFSGVSKCDLTLVYVVLPLWVRAWYFLHMSWFTPFNILLSVVMSVVPRVMDVAYR